MWSDIANAAVSGIGVGISGLAQKAAQQQSAYAAQAAYNAIYSQTVSAVSQIGVLAAMGGLYGLDDPVLDDAHVRSREAWLRARKALRDRLRLKHENTRAELWALPMISFATRWKARMGVWLVCAGIGVLIPLLIGVVLFAWRVLIHLVVA